MGKVGSQSVVSSLERSELGRPVLHVHFLTDAGLEREARSYRSNWEPSQRAAHVFSGQALRSRRKRRPEECWDVVTLVRDPVARNLSSFFQIGERQYGQDFASVQSDPEGARRRLTEAFLNRFDAHDHPLCWFEAEFERALGIDVYATEFGHDEGFTIIEGRAARVLVLKLERLAEASGEAFRRFFGLSELPLAERNITDDKAHGDLYRRFVDDIRLPQEYLERMYSSRFARHFFTPAEVDGLISKWCA